MEYHECDLCGSIITANKYAMAIEKLLKVDKSQELRDIMYNTKDYLLKKEEQIKVYEVCEECKKLWDRLMKLRKQKVEQLKKDSDSVLEDLL